MISSHMCKIKEKRAMHDCVVGKKGGRREEGGEGDEEWKDLLYDISKGTF